MTLSKKLTRDTFPHLFQQAGLRIRMFVDSTFGAALMRWWGVQAGPGLCLVGIPKVRRAPRGHIQLGERCKFISLFSANSHGVTRPCFLAATLPGSRIQIGDMCGFSGTVITAAQSIVVGNRVQCGANTIISDNDAHSLNASVRRQELEGTLPRGANHAESRPVIIHDDVWLGMNVTVLKGVEIGARSVIGAGSLVTKSIPPDSLAVGVPARVIKSLRSGND